MHATHTAVLDSCMARLTRDAIETYCVPESVAREAARRTRRNLLSEVPKLDPGTRSRAKKYFWAVIVNRSLSSSDPRLRRVRNGILTATIERELRAAGYSEGQIADEIAAHYPYLRAPEVTAAGASA